MATQAPLNAVTSHRVTAVHAQDDTVAIPLQDIVDEIGPPIAENGAVADVSDTFSNDNYALLKERRVFSALVPADLGGSGHSYAQMCAFLTSLAGYHPSTALSCAMHQHVVAAQVYNHRHGKPGRALLEKVAVGELALVSTGAGDWLASNGELEKVDGGYRFTATKHFASGSPAADILATSAPYNDPVEGWQVFHFPVSLKADGVTVLDNWAPMGMRGSGSNSVRIEKVFVPEASISGRRPRGDFHAMWCVVLPVALPLIMSVYRGIAEKAARIARERCRDSVDPATPYLLGEMENALTTVQLAVDDMIRTVGDYSFVASPETVDAIVRRKTIAAEAAKQTVMKALEACGGPGFMRANGLECLLRDVMASHFHPLQEKRQLLFTGALAMGKEPPAQAF